MKNAYHDRIAEAADEFARSIAPDNLAVQIRLFTAVYNIASEVADNAADSAAAAAVLHRIISRATPTTTNRLRETPRTLGSAGDGPGGSILDDEVFLRNSRYVITADTRILGGTPTSDFPDCVAVGMADRWCCSGTLIAPTVVVSAGHCAAVACSQRVFFGTNVHRPEAGRAVAVERAFTHPGYKPPRPFNDLVVLVLAEPVTDVPARQIADAGALSDAGSVRLVGYGATESRGIGGSGERRFVDVPLASSDPLYGVASRTEFVAGRPFLDRDSCPGDSGGPAYVETADGWELVGATSRGTPGGERSGECGDGGIYTLIAAHREWIESVVGPLRPRG